MGDLTERQLKFIEGKLAGKSSAQAARDAGYSESVANVAGKKIARKPAVQAKLQELMEPVVRTEESVATTSATHKTPELSAEHRRLIADFEKLPQAAQPVLRFALADLAKGKHEIAMMWLNCFREQLQAQ